jgi:hypothetical protein
MKNDKLMSNKGLLKTSIKLNQHTFTHKHDYDSIKCIFMVLTTYFNLKAQITYICDFLSNFKWVKYYMLLVLVLYVSFVSSLKLCIS